MPFIGKTLGVHVTPEEVGDGSTVECPGCGGGLKPRKAHERNGSFVARHFFHINESDCDGLGGGRESMFHQKMKSIAASKAKNEWPDATVSIEQPVGDRRADVLVEFSDRHNRYGDGIAIEAQHMNESKDIAEVTSDFVAKGYSCLWLWEDQYAETDVEFDKGCWKTYWAHRVPPIDEWGGYSPVVRWLHQEKPTEVNLHITFPVSANDLIPRRVLRQAWFSGFKESFEEPKMSEWRSGRHENADSEWVDVFKRHLSQSRTKKWLKLVESPTGELCFQVGKTTGRGSADSTTIQVSGSDYEKFLDLIACFGAITDQEVSE